MTVWSAHLYDPETRGVDLELGVEPSVEDAQEFAEEYLRREIPTGATWTPHGSHRRVLTLDGKPVIVRRDTALAQVVVAEREIPGVLVP
ncbi:hypothetical protein [Actinoallomurus sp. CA-142502]|uniref:hypothetical protein n=1 Tax=Actinoallomurus sp. CA-142502 TaxID=3239885 RepID=UPI003D8A4E4C